MSSFSFKALNFAGASTVGEMEADDAQGVANQLRSKGMIALEIKERSPASAGDVLSRFRKVKSQELTVASRQLATMLSSGMSLIRAIGVLEEQASSDKFKEALAQIRTDVEGGMFFSEALAQHPSIFNELYTAMVSAGESGGFLEQTLARVADQLEKDDSLRRQVKSAMIYPSVIGGFALLVLVALVVFLVPVFAKVFEDFGGELPGITKFTVALSNAMISYWYLFILGTVAAVYLFRRWKRTERGRMQWDSFKLKTPWKIGGIVQKVALARFSRTFSSLVAAGVPMLEAIEITGRTSGNKVVEKAMADVRESVMTGGTVAAPMRNVPQAFPVMVTQMVAVGEETGALEDMLSKIADFYDDEVAAAVKALTSILEPVMIIVVGSIVGFIVISMYLPMFKVYDQIK